MIKKDCFKAYTHLAPLKRVINERNVDTKRPIRPGTISDGIKTEAAEARLSIILGINVCRKWFPKGLLNVKSVKLMVQFSVE